MRQCDVAIIGAGLLGCFAARAMAETALDTIVIEKREDVCAEISKANTGIIYTGCDTKPGTLKTQLTVKANRGFDLLCQQLHVPFHRCGSLMLSFGERADAVLKKKYGQGLENGVEGLDLLSTAQVLEMEPEISEKVRGALYAPGTGTVEPWSLGIAAYENAKANGTQFRLNEALLDMRCSDGGIILETDKETYRAKAVINCAGLRSDRIRELVEKPLIRIFPSSGEYLVFDHSLEGSIKHIILHEPEEKGKGLTLVPTTDGSILAGPTEHDASALGDYAAEKQGLEQLLRLCSEIVPALPADKLIRSFGAVRPNPYYVREENGTYLPESRGISNFTILEEDGLFSLIGIKTPGLSCANELGLYMRARICAFLNCREKNPGFDPERRLSAPARELSLQQRQKLIEENADYGEIVCRCRQVSRAEIAEAIARGAETVDAVKRRTGAGMGRCQGGRCGQIIAEMLAKAQGIDVGKVQKDGPGTSFFGGAVNG